MSEPTSATGGGRSARRCKQGDPVERNVDSLVLLGRCKMSCDTQRLPSKQTSRKCGVRWKQRVGVHPSISGVLVQRRFVEVISGECNPDVPLLIGQLTCQSESICQSTRCVFVSMLAHLTVSSRQGLLMNEIRYFQHEYDWVEEAVSEAHYGQI